MATAAAPIQNTCRSTTSLLTPGHTAATAHRTHRWLERKWPAVWRGKYYAIGGRTGPSDAVEQFNPATISWSTVASLSQARGGLGAASWNDKIYAVGGRSGGAYGQNTIYGTFE